MSNNRKRALAQQAPRNSAKTTVKTENSFTVKSAFHQPSNRDFVKKMTIEVDRELHAELKVIAAQEGITIREIVNSYLEEYVQKHR